MEEAVRRVGQAEGAVKVVEARVAALQVGWWCTGAMVLHAVVMHACTSRPRGWRCRWVVQWGHDCMHPC